MLDQTPEQKAQLSIDIEKLIHTELQDIIAFYTRKYLKRLEKTLGMTSEDILNDVRVQIWKGLITWDPSKPANRKTYLNNIIQMRFASLYEQSCAKKNSLIEYCGWNFNSDAHTGSVSHAPSGEDLMIRREELMTYKEDLLSDETGSMSTWESQIFDGLMLGLSIDDMTRMVNLDRVKVTSLIKQVTKKIDAIAIRGTEDE